MYSSNGSGTDSDAAGGSSDGDDDDDALGSARATWSGPGPLMSRAVRQAALRQLQQYQRAWRVSQQED
jgi:hypothetical protein